MQFGKLRDEMIYIQKEKNCIIVIERAIGDLGLKERLEI